MHFVLLGIRCLIQFFIVFYQAILVLLQTLLMLGVTIEVVLQFFHLVLVRVDRSVRDVDIAFVVASGLLSMPGPVAQTQPAEVVATFLACHVHATLILLDIHLALRTWLCVILDEVGSQLIRYACN